MRHLFRVAASLDSVVIGEGQIAGQVKDAYELAQKASATGPLLNALFPAAPRGLQARPHRDRHRRRGTSSVSSAAVDFVRQVFDHFGDKTVLVIGAGKMGRLTLKHLRELNPARILVTNRSPEKAAAVAAECGGERVPWEQLDDGLVQADIVLSTTGAPEPIVTRRRFDDKVRYQRGGRPLVDLRHGRAARLRPAHPRRRPRQRVQHRRPDPRARPDRRRTAQARPRGRGDRRAEVAKFVQDWNRRKDGPVIGQLTAEVDRVRDAVLEPLLAKLNGKLTDAEKAYIEGAFRLFQNRLLHGPIAALQEASREGHSHSLREALMKLFGLKG